MKRRKPPATPLGDAVQAYLEKTRLKRRLDQASVIPEWPELVGPQIAQVAHPQHVTPDGVLIVSVKSSAWIQELQMMSADILRQLGKRGKKIKRIVWRQE